MVIVKVINNNVVSSTDSKGREIIVMGSGIGFGKKAGDEICQDKIEKKYHLSDEVLGQFEQLVQDIPYEHLKLATMIIDEAKTMLTKDLSKSIYVTLTDHLNFAIERQKQGIDFENALRWEIKKFYPTEYGVGKKAVEIVRQQTGITLSQNEEASIALHFINAEVGGNLEDTISMPELVKEILNIVRYTLMIEFDEESMNYNRFVTHLKYFVGRAIKKEYYEEEDSLVFDNIISAYPEEFQCALKIKAYMEGKVDYTVPREELMYLTVHINRVKRRLK